MKYRTMQKISFVIAACLVVSLTACKQNATDNDTFHLVGKPEFADSFNSYVKVYNQEGKILLQRTNCSYELAEIKGDQRTKVLLKIIQQETLNTDSANNTTQYTISAHGLNDKTISWVKNITATDLDIKKNYLSTKLEGADQEEELYTLYSLKDGKELIRYSYGELALLIPGTADKRFIGFTSRIAASQPLTKLNDKSVVGLITYASTFKTIEQFKIKVKDSNKLSKFPAYTPELQLTSTNDRMTTTDGGKSMVVLSSGEGVSSKDITDIAINLFFTFGDNNEIAKVVLPITNDHIDLAKANYDKTLFDLEAVENK